MEARAAYSSASLTARLLALSRSAPSSGHELLPCVLSLFFAGLPSSCLAGQVQWSQTRSAFIFLGIFNISFIFEGQVYISAHFLVASKVSLEKLTDHLIEDPYM